MQNIAALASHLASINTLTTRTDGHIRVKPLEHVAVRTNLGPGQLLSVTDDAWCQVRLTGEARTDEYPIELCTLALPDATGPRQLDVVLLADLTSIPEDDLAMGVASAGLDPDGEAQPWSAGYPQSGQTVAALDCEGTMRLWVVVAKESGPGAGMPTAMVRLAGYSSNARQQCSVASEVYAVTSLRPLREV
jgi:hypothetical protein